MARWGIQMASRSLAQRRGTKFLSSLLGLNGWNKVLYYSQKLVFANPW